MTGYKKISLIQLLSFFKCQWKILFFLLSFLFVSSSAMSFVIFKTNYRSTISFEYGVISSEGQRVSKNISTVELFGDFGSVLNNESFIKKVYDSLESSNLKKGIGYYKKGISYPSFSITSMSPFYTISFSYKSKECSETFSQSFSELGIVELQNYSHSFDYTIVSSKSNNAVKTLTFYNRILIILLLLFLSTALVFLISLLWLYFRRPILFSDIDDYKKSFHYIGYEKSLYDLDMLNTKEKETNMTNCEPGLLLLYDSKSDIKKCSAVANKNMASAIPLSKYERGYFAESIDLSRKQTIVFIHLGKTKTSTLEFIKSRCKRENTYLFICKRWF